MFLTIALVALSSALAVIYFWKIVEKLFFSSKGYKASAEDPAIYIPIWIVAISLIYFGVFSSPIVEFSSIAADSLIEGGISE
jgi:NADH:ubiquinone oxidoreductase subunit 2 (subunit N)